VNYARQSGILETLNFAKAHHKPLSIPEWAVAPVSEGFSAGDDPAYVDGIAQTVRDNAVAYQAYFFTGPFAAQLANGPGSLASYRRHFGAWGDSLPRASTTTSVAPVSPAAADPAASGSHPPSAAPSGPAGPPRSPSPGRVKPSASVLRQSAASASAAAQATAKRVRRLGARRPRVVHVRLKAALAGTLCVGVSPDGNAARLTCDGRHIRLSTTGQPHREIATTAATTPMSRMRAGLRPAVLRVSLKRANAKRRGQRAVTVVSVFIPTDDPTVVSVASRKVRLTS
jgi:hypothetical protein